MTNEIYQAMKRRISVAPFSEEDKKYYEEQGWDIPTDAIHYRLYLGDLGDDYFDYCHCMRTSNIWNVAQRFWSLIGNEELASLLLNA